MYTYTALQLQSKTFVQLKSIARELDIVPTADRRCRQNWIDALVGLNPPLLQLLENSPAASAEQAREPIIETVEKSPGVEPVQERIEDYFHIKELWELDHADCPACGGIDSLHARWSREYAYGYWIIYCEECDSTCSCSVEDLPPCLRGEDDDDDTDSEDSPGVEIYSVQELIAPATQIPPGVTFSSRFLARYFPPQPEIHYQADAGGQLTLLDFEVQSQPEPPDPDDFESLDAFREAIARWDTENPELLAASIDSMCEWTPCPEEWYWPKAEILPLKASSTIDLSLPSEQSEVMELSIASESSITCNFFIPTFGALGDRFNRSDEPPDTGIYARLLKPKPPSFPPMAASQARAKCILNISRTHTHCIVAGSSTQPTRSPPGGDASF